jgi:hypothetical protein
MHLKKILLCCAILLSVTSLAQSKPAITSAPIPEWKTTVSIDPQKPLSPPAYIYVEKPDGSHEFKNTEKTVQYYHDLGLQLSRRNPIAEAKKAFDSGRYVVFVEQLAYGFSSDLIQYGRSFPKYKRHYAGSKKLDSKFLQGERSLEEWRNRMGGRNNKVLTSYGKAAIWYAYYWNRTMYHNLNAHFPLQ